MISLSRDKNGNKIIKLSKSADWPEASRGFSVQTNGNLPKTHQDGIGPWTEYELEAYIRKYGTTRQKFMLHV